MMTKPAIQETIETPDQLHEARENLATWSARCSEVAKALRLQEHYKAIGMTEITLFQFARENWEQMPWEWVTRFEASGSWRLGCVVSINVYAEHSGLSFRWSVDVENRGSNCTGVLNPDVEKLRKICDAIPTRKLTQEFKGHLEAIRLAIIAQANEIETTVTRLRRDAAALGVL